MENRTEAFIFASPEIEQLLADNGVSFDEALRREGYDVSKGASSDPASDAEVGTRAVATTILASAAVIAALTPVLLKIIESLTYKGAIVHDTVLVPVEDSSGNVVTDSSGEPKLQWVRKAEFLESSRGNSAQEIKIKALGFEIEIKNQG